MIYFTSDLQIHSEFPPVVNVVIAEVFKLAIKIAVVASVAFFVGAPVNVAVGIFAALFPIELAISLLSYGAKELGFNKELCNIIATVAKIYVIVKTCMKVAAMNLLSGPAALTVGIVLILTS